MTTKEMLNTVTAWACAESRLARLDCYTPVSPSEAAHDHKLEEISTRIKGQEPRRVMHYGPAFCSRFNASTPYDLTSKVSEVNCFECLQWVIKNEFVRANTTQQRKTTEVVDLWLKAAPARIVHTTSRCSQFSVEDKVDVISKATCRCCIQVHRDWQKKDKAPEPRPLVHFATAPCSKDVMNKMDSVIAFQLECVTCKECLRRYQEKVKQLGKVVETL